MNTKPSSPPLSGPQRAMRKLGLIRPIDLALHVPLRYEDHTRLYHVADLDHHDDGQMRLLEGHIIASEWTGRQRPHWRVMLSDGDHVLALRFFNPHPALEKTLTLGKKIRVFGEVKLGHMGAWDWSIMHPAITNPETPLPTQLTPIYPSSAGLPQSYLRKAIQSALARIPKDSTLPEWALPSLQSLLQQQGLPPVVATLYEAVQALHHPPPHPEQDQPPAQQSRLRPAWQRLVIEELLAHQLLQRRAIHARAKLTSPMLLIEQEQGSQPEQLRQRLPFTLTRAQDRVIAEITADLGKGYPMYRLLQGDVGAGKTVVAAMCAMVAIDAGWQCALMAPTEILAQQHFAKLVEWLTPLLEPHGQCVAWLIGGQKKKERQAMLSLIQKGQAALVVGTHAIISEQVQFARLGLVIVDEQHRFGVAQRLRLRSKSNPLMVGDTDTPTPHPLPPHPHPPITGLEPHMLMMSATPIPRTLAMSYYADLKVSTIDELPPGRTPIVTKLVAHTRRHEIILRLTQQLQIGRQAYWVCPLIEESEQIDLTNATETHAELVTALAQYGFTVGLMHARLPTADKHALMQRFIQGEVAVLVSTTVIEVGVDVPNATLMVIDHAERFGLSQLHQLRGRVGRGSAASACVLLYYPIQEGAKLGQAAKERLMAMQQTNDGFEIAQRDLQIRGPGELMGERQSGAPLLRFGDLNRDEALIQWAAQIAETWLNQDPASAQRHLQRWLDAELGFLWA